jgi:serine phosphatase RsbU (regulator of sigma subunit)
MALLPTRLPAHPYLDVAWHMETATEVGGDYYDYSLGPDGTLTLALGDATGHGMQAGMVVTATKSLFKSLADQPAITETFTAMSRSLKGMDLPRLGMAFAIAKIKDYHLTVSSAGMPPVLIYRALSGDIDEVEIPGVPLGFTAQFEYEQRDLDLLVGDVIVLMSDGLPERRNANDDELGYVATQALFRESVDSDPIGICKHMAEGGNTWAAGRPQDDDVTFVVIKVR